MNKPMEPKTRGLSAGHAACWDARSDADIVDRLLAVEAPGYDSETVHEAADEIVRLREENERLSELMKKLVENAEGGDYGEIIVLDGDFTRIEKELNNE